MHIKILTNFVINTAVGLVPSQVLRHLLVQMYCDDDIPVVCMYGKDDGKVNPG